MFSSCLADVKLWRTVTETPPLARDSSRAVAVQAQCATSSTIFHKNLRHSDINPPKCPQTVHHHHHARPDRRSLNTEFVDSLCTFQKWHVRKTSAHVRHTAAMFICTSCIQLLFIVQFYTRFITAGLTSSDWRWCVFIHKVAGLLRVRINSVWIVGSMWTWTVKQCWPSFTNFITNYITENNLCRVEALRCLHELQSFLGQPQFQKQLGRCVKCK